MVACRLGFSGDGFGFPRVEKKGLSQSKKWEDENSCHRVGGLTSESQSCAGSDTCLLASP